MRDIERIEIKIIVFTKTDNEDAFAVLGHKALRINNAILDVIAKFFGQSAADNIKGLAAIMADKVFDVFEQKGLGLVILDDPGDIEEQRPPRYTKLNKVDDSKVLEIGRDDSARAKVAFEDLKANDRSASSLAEEEAAV